MPKRRHTDVLQEMLPPLAGLELVDIGCGGGALVGWLRRRGAEAVGIDAQAGPLRKAVAAAAPVAAATATALPFAAGRFGATLIFNSLHHFPEPAAALMEARRVTAAAGILYVVEPLAHGPHFMFMQPVDDETEVRARALAALDAAGASNWALETSFDYAYDVVVSDLGAELRGWIAVDPARAPRIASSRAEIENRFRRHGVVTEQGHAFEQPMRAWVFQAA